jgi:hypothetical protein
MVLVVGLQDLILSITVNSNILSTIVIGMIAITALSQTVSGKIKEAQTQGNAFLTLQIPTTFLQLMISQNMIFWVLKEINA